MNRTRAITTPRIDIDPTGEQVVDQADLPSHHRPMDRLIGTLVTLMQQFGLSVDQAERFFRLADRAGHSDSPV